MTTAAARLELAPSAGRLIGSLRDVGYDFESAVADVIDNSLAAGARQVDVDIRFAGEDSWIRISDDGTGMPPSVITEGMRLGSRRTYNGGDLGRFGLGLKTASISQCRRLTVASRAGKQRRRIHVRRLDLESMAERDRWEIEVLPPHMRSVARATEPLSSASGTVVLWERIDRILDYRDPAGAWAKRRFETLESSLRQHLALVFHRFLSGEARRAIPFALRVNGQPVRAWDPFARSESETVQLSVASVSMERPVGAVVRFTPYVLPHRSAFSSPEAFERAAGPLKWNRAQGLYVYRGDRLIQGGGWAGIRAIDEHTKFARAAVDFDPSLDELFKVNVAKMSVSLPPAVRGMLEPRVAELCRTASHRYRRGELAARSANGARPTKGSLRTAGIALQAAAMEVGRASSLGEISARLRLRNPDLADELGL